ncbi:MAG TPA: DUF1501 domain-containing protein [Bryobacteraceae bacterium]|nr:DUF1501 domain-containing protein [Bryobacteraceae bacterium]
MAHEQCRHCNPGGGKVSRRAFFDRVSDGLHGAALATLFSRDIFGATPEMPDGHRASYDLKSRAPNFAPKAKSVIHMFMNGGPSQMDLFDPKPMLDKHHGEPYFDKLAADITTPEQSGGLMRSPFKFAQYGKSGMWVSDAMPHLTEVVDDIAVIRSMQTMHPNHEPALFMIQSGRIIPGRPSMGSWVVYGLGSENQNLPAYVVLDDPLGLPINGPQNWQAGFLPPLYQGTRIRSTGSPILNLTPDAPESGGVVQAGRELLSRLDQIHKTSRPNQLQLDARIASYELAANLQMTASDALDISKESPETLAMYGVGQHPTDSYARRCIMARRLIERGVRFVQLYINSQIWDNHTFLARDMKAAAARTDQPAAALIKDLKQRGLLNDTLVIWGGEFGRMPIAQMENGMETAGRDHNPNAFSLWMAGAGIKAGTVFGTTDELGHEAVENKVSVTDWHATILHLLGLDYQRLVFDQNGLKDKLTSVFDCRVVKEILA